MRTSGHDCPDIEYQLKSLMNSNLGAFTETLVISKSRKDEEKKTPPSVAKTRDAVFVFKSNAFRQLASGQ
jgi:hypothetical protein